MKKEHATILLTQNTCNRSSLSIPLAVYNCKLITQKLRIQSAASALIRLLIYIYVHMIIQWYIRKRITIHIIKNL